MIRLASLLLLFGFTLAFAQPSVSSYTHTEAALPGKSATFSAQDSVAFAYVMQTGKKPLSLPLPKGRALADILSILKVSKSLKAEDALLIERALVAWDSAKADLGYMVTKSGLRYMLLSKGTGKLPEAGKKVTVHYRGTLANGKEFDNSYTRNQPITFTLGQKQVIAGWDEGIQLLPVGSKGRLKIPARLGYGSREIPNLIPANSTLYFDVEVVSAE